MLTPVLMLLAGWCAGLALNYLADTLPVYRRLTPPFCRFCQSRQAAMNYLLWPRRCQQCGRRRGWRSWIVEAAAAGTAIWLWQRSAEAGEFLFGFVLLTYFGLVLVIDLEHRLILHPVSLAGGILGLGAGLWRHGIFTTLTGGLAGFAIMFGLYLLGGVFARLFIKSARSSVDQVALGFGDVALAGVLGLVLGWPGIIPGLVLTIILGGIVSLIYLFGMLITHRYQPFSAIPYGPFLLASAVLLLYFKNPLVSLFSP